GVEGGAILTPPQYKPARHHVAEDRRLAENRRSEEGAWSCSSSDVFMRALETRAPWKRRSVTSLVRPVRKLAALAFRRSARPVTRAFSTSILAGSTKLHSTIT